MSRGRLESATSSREQREAELQRERVLQFLHPGAAAGGFVGWETAQRRPAEMNVAYPCPTAGWLMFRGRRSAKRADGEGGLAFEGDEVTRQPRLFGVVCILASPSTLDETRLHREQARDGGARAAREGLRRCSGAARESGTGGGVRPTEGRAGVASGHLEQHGGSRHGDGRGERRRSNGRSATYMGASTGRRRAATDGCADSATRPDSPCSRARDDARGKEAYV